MEAAKFTVGQYVHRIGNHYPKLMKDDYAPRFKIVAVKRIEDTWQYSIAESGNQIICYSEDQLAPITPKFARGQTVVQVGSLPKEYVIQDDVRLAASGDFYEIKLGTSDTSWYPEDKFELKTPGMKLGH